MVVVCGLASYWNFKKFKGTSFQSFSFENLAEPEPPKEEPENSTIEEKEWVSSDGKLKLKYSQDWIEYDKILLEQLKQESTNTLETEPLLYAMQMSTGMTTQTETINLLTVEKINSKKNFDEIIELIEKSPTQDEVEIVSSQNQGNFASLEFKTKPSKENNFYFHSIMKIFFRKEETYLITFSTPESYFSKQTAEGNKILNSAEFSD